MKITTNKSTVTIKQMPKNTIKEMAWQEKQPTHKFVKDKGYPKACKVCERVKDNPIHSLDKETKYKLIHTCKVDINGIGACGCSTYQIVPPQTDKELCIKCKKYPAEKAQTYCEFCLGISEPQTDKTTEEDIENIRKGKVISLIMKQAGQEALDVYRGKLKKEWNERIEEVKQGLDETYGSNHNYTPNYEGIFEELLESLTLEK